MTGPAPMPTAHSVDLAALLAGWDVERLAQLLDRRPDLAHPAPGDLTQLANRAGSIPSQAAARTQLDEFTVAALDAVIIAGGDIASARRLLGDPPQPALTRALDRLAELGFLDTSNGLRVPTEVLAWPAPAGLGPPYPALATQVTNAELTRICRESGLLKPPSRKVDLLDTVAGLLAEPATVRRLLAAGPEGTVELAERVATQGPLLSAPGYYSGYERRHTPTSWLEHCGLFVRLDWTRCLMPREVALALRGNRLFEALHWEPPPLRVHPVDPARVDAAAADAALRLVSVVGELCAAWESTPAKQLANGGLGTRELRRAAKLLGRDERDVARIAELAAAAGLVGVDAATDTVQPLSAYDEWLDSEVPARWRWLLAAWWCWDRHLSLAGALGGNGKTIPALAVRAPEADPESRRVAVLAALAEAAGEVEPAQVIDRVRWARPALWRDGPAPPSLLVTWVLEEAVLLGIVADGALAGAGRSLLAGDLDAATAALTGFAPAPVRDLVLQGDLTAVVAGELPPGDRVELELLADAVSTGSASVYRFSETTLRRAFDAGRNAEQITTFLAERATRGIPQVLAYLIGDISRRHGRLRIGTASCYLRCDDPALVAEVLATRRLARLGLRAIAPGVLVSAEEPEAVLTALRDGGFLPALEDDAGTLVVRTRPRSRAKPNRQLAALTRRAPGGGGGFGPVEARLRSLLGGESGSAGGAVAAPDSRTQKLAASLHAAGVRRSGHLRSVPDHRASAEAALPLDWAAGRTEMGVEAPPNFTLSLLPDVFDGFDDDLDDDPDSGLPRPTETVHDRSAIADLLSIATEEGWPVQLSSTSGSGRQTESFVFPEAFEASRFDGLCLPRFLPRSFPLHRVHWVRVLSVDEEVALGV